MKIRLNIVRVGLIGTGLFALTVGLGHVFFPQAAHDVVGQKAFDPNHPFMGLAALELGVLFSIIGIASVIAAFDPIKHKWLVFLVTLSCILSDLVRSKANCPRMWIVMTVSIVFWGLIVIFYPYKEIRKG